MAPAPAGFMLSDAITPVSFTAPGQIVDMQFEDLLLASLKVVKVDALNPNTMLDGASFKLYDNADLADTHQVGVEKTTGDGGNTGFVEFDNLTPGKDYWILETKAPTDYKLPDPNVAYKVTVPSGLTVFTVQDEYNPPHPYPPTATSNWNFLVIGGLALLAGVLLIILSRKRKTVRVRTHAR
jgi:LPXTG-motif cell wall-anchored protein